MTYLVQITYRNLCCWCSVVDGVVRDVPPVARWMRGRSGKSVVRYWRLRGATVTWQLAPPR